MFYTTEKNGSPIVVEIPDSHAVKKKVQYLVLYCTVGKPNDTTNNEQQQRIDIMTAGVW